MFPSAQQVAEELVIVRHDVALPNGLELSGAAQSHRT
jgi:hypothetical protein